MTNTHTKAGIILVSATLAFVGMYSVSKSKENDNLIISLRTEQAEIETQIVALQPVYKKAAENINAITAQSLSLHKKTEEKETQIQALLKNETVK